MSEIELRDWLQKNELDFLASPENFEKVSIETIEHINSYLENNLINLSQTDLKEIFPIINKYNDKFRNELKDKSWYYNFAFWSSNIYSNDNWYDINQSLIGRTIITKINKSKNY